MEIKEKIKIEKEEEIVKEAFCDFCQERFDEEITKVQGYGIIRMCFGYGSVFDDDVFYLEICDKCFVKKFAEKLKKQLDKKGYAPETIKSVLEDKQEHQ